MRLSLFIFVAMLLSSTAADAQDWQNFKRYAADNAKLHAQPIEQNRVVFMGNSITEGWLNLRPEYFKDKPFVNRGIGGQTTPQMLIRFRPDVLDLMPEKVVILAGINDIAGNTGPSTLKMITDNIVSMVELARMNDIEVLLCSVLPAYDFPWRPGLEPAEKVVKLNMFLQGYAAACDDVHYVDYFSAMADDKNGLRADLGDDGVHPNAKGYEIMERILDRALEMGN